MNDQPLTVRPIAAAATHPLRLSVLRDNDPSTDLALPGDAAADTLHVGVFAGATLVGVGTILCQPMANRPEAAGWRLRGMAVAPAWRSRGVGGLLIEALIDHARAQGGTLVWCNARVPAQRFYERHGLCVEGAQFELPRIGPHYVMWRWL